MGTRYLEPVLGDDGKMLEVSQDFIEEGKLCKVVQKKPNAPYSKKDRLARRKEAYRLHFELGYSAVKISDMMKVHRNTINEDIKYWYSKLIDQFNEYGFEAIMQEYIIRLESQRTRLLELLDKEKELMSKLAIERLITDVESRLQNILFRIAELENYYNKYGLKMANDALKKIDNQKKFFYSPWETILVSKAQREAINKILRSKI